MHETLSNNFDDTEIREKIFSRQGLYLQNINSCILLKRYFWTIISIQVIPNTRSEKNYLKNNFLGKSFKNSVIGKDDAKSVPLNSATIYVEIVLKPYTCITQSMTISPKISCGLWIVKRNKRVFSYFFLQYFHHIILFRYPSKDAFHVFDVLTQGFLSYHILHLQFDIFISYRINSKYIFHNFIHIIYSSRSHCAIIPL